MTFKSLDLYRMPDSNPTTNQNFRSLDLMNSTQSSSSPSMPPPTFLNRSWTASPQMSEARLTNLMSQLSSYPSTTTMPSFNRERTVSSLNPGPEFSFNHNRAFKDQLYASSVGGSSSAYFSHLKTPQDRDLASLALKNLNLCVKTPFADCSMPDLSRYSSKSFLIDNFPSLYQPPLHQPPANNTFASQFSDLGGNQLRSFMDKELSSLYSPSRGLWTSDDRAFQAFQKIRDNSLTSPSAENSFNRPAMDGASSILMKSSGVAPISAARIATIDSAIGLWNGTKRALAQIGLDQMDISGEERMAILNTMIATQQVGRAAFKEKMLALATHPKSPSRLDWFDADQFLTPLKQSNVSWKGSKESVYDFERAIQVNMLCPNLSRPYDLGRPELPRGQIGIINGIMNAYCEANSTSELLSSIAGGTNIHSVYNASTGFVSDNVKVFLGMKDPSITRGVLSLHKTWDNFFAKAEPCERFLQFCHSGGATQCRLALESYSPELRQRIEVAAISPATYIPRELCHRVNHYISTRDFVPKIFRDAKVGMDTVTMLTPHPDVPLLAKVIYVDHRIDSPTFRKAIKERIMEYIKDSSTW